MGGIHKRAGQISNPRRAFRKAELPSNPQRVPVPRLPCRWRPSRGPARGALSGGFWGLGLGRPTAHCFTMRESPWQASAWPPRHVHLETPLPPLLGIDRTSRCSPREQRQPPLPDPQAGPRRLSRPGRCTRAHTQQGVSIPAQCQPHAAERTRVTGPAM